MIVLNGHDEGVTELFDSSGEMRALLHARMPRRNFLASLAALQWAGPALAQIHERLRVIGVLSGLVPDDPEAQKRVAAFTDAMRQLGWDHTRIRLERRFSGGKPQNLPALAMELVQINSDVIVAEAAQAVDAARSATQTVPIVMVYVGDALGPGYVASLARPGGNITGQTLVATDQAAKRLDLVRRVRPGISLIAVISNLNASGHRHQRKELDLAAPGLHLTLQQLPIRSPDEIDKALNDAVEAGAQALITMEDPMIESLRTRIVRFAAEKQIVVMGEFKPMTRAGGLISYGPDQVAMWARSAVYVDKIFRGAHPGQLPVEQPAKFELTINLNTARSLRIEVPDFLLATADEIID